MKVSETNCPVCYFSGSCGCLSRLQRYFELLQVSNQRVSTCKVTSEDPAFLCPQRALIDKLNSALLTPIPRNVLFKRLEKAQLSSRLIKLKDKRWYLEIGGSLTGFYFRVNGNTEPHVANLITRPSAYQSFFEYKSVLRSVLMPEELSSMRLTRLDLALDFPVNLDGFLRSFDVIYKRSKISYLDEGAQRTGLIVGRGNEKILVYDKAREQHLPNPLTRLELQISGRKLPTKSFDELPFFFSSENTWSPFEHIELNSITDRKSLALTPTESARLSEFRSLLSREGYLSARRVFNKQGNFDRDYKPLIEIRRVKNQPSQNFKRLIHNFFNQPKKEKQWKLH